MLQCPICLRNGFQRLTRHFSQVHGLGKKEVLAEYPDLVLEVEPPAKEVKCSGCGRVLIGVNPRAAYVKCEACRKPDPNSTRQQIECLLCGKQARRLWLHLRSMHKMTLDQYRSQHPKAETEFQESKERSMACRLKQASAATSRWSDPAERAAQSARLPGPPASQGRGIGGFRKDLPHYTRSTLEANFARLLRLLGVPYEYEPKCFKLLDGQGHYTPDFHLALALMEGNRVIIPAGWVELKGWRTKEGGLPAGTQEKVDALRAIVPGTAVTVIVQSDGLWRRLEQQYAPFIDLWETPRRNLRTNPELF